MMNGIDAVKRILILPLLIGLIGCNLVDSDAGEIPVEEDKEMPNGQDTQDMKEETNLFGGEALYAANETEQIIVQGDQLRIGVGAMRTGNFIDANGQEQTGALAHLSFFVRDRPDLETDMDVHEGSVVTVAGYRVRMTDINLDEELVVVKIAAPVEQGD